MGNDLITSFEEVLGHESLIFRKGKCEGQVCYQPLLPQFYYTLWILNISSEYYVYTMDFRLIFILILCTMDFGLIFNLILYTIAMDFDLIFILILYTMIFGLISS